MARKLTHGTLSQMTLLGQSSLVVDSAEREQWRQGALHLSWSVAFPMLFDSDDIRLADGRYAQGRHYYEWKGAILLHQQTGYHALVCKYEYRNHERKCRVVEALLEPSVLGAIRNRPPGGSAQAPDLLMFAPDMSDYFFCEVKGPCDRLRASQRVRFDVLAKVSGRPVRILRFTKRATGIA